MSVIGAQWNMTRYREIELQEIARCVRKLKTGSSDVLVGELLKYGGSGMLHLLHKLFEVVWSEELVYSYHRNGARA